MIVCICKGISDRRLDAEIRSGCKTLGEVQRGCGAGTDCGMCVKHIRRLLRSVHAHEESSGRSGAESR